jgi:nickel-dependent lactate racemase
MSQVVISKTADAGTALSATDVQSLIEQACPSKDYRGKRVLLIVPDGTRTAPIGLLFKTLHAQIGSVTSEFDVLIALGTHPPMSEKAICERLEISSSERSTQYANVSVFNHQWDNPDALQEVGIIPEEEIAQLSNGLFSMLVEVKINRRLFEYDQARLSRIQ